MLVDSRTLENGRMITADVCIVGSGPAGSVIATELAKAGHTVAVLESGGAEKSEEVQDLARGSVSGQPFDPPIKSRARTLGGTSHLWDNGVAGGTLAFRCGMLSPIDFEERAWVPYSGWPITLAELSPYAERVKEICGFQGCGFEGEPCATEEHPTLKLDPDLVRTTVWRYAYQRIFTEEFPARLRESEQITTYLYADVTELKTNEAGTAITTVEARTLRGNSLRVSCRIAILAAGGMENPRLLLLSRSRHPQGIGNGRDLVGRFFMEHPYIHAGMFEPRSVDALRKLTMYDIATLGSGRVTAKLNLSEETLRRERLLNSGMTMVPRHRWYNPDGVQAARELYRAIRGSGAANLETIRRIGRGLPYIAVNIGRKLTRNNYLCGFIEAGPTILDFGWSKNPDLGGRFQRMEMLLVCELAPHPDNRVTLSQELDPLDRPRVHLHCEFRSADIDSILRTQDVYARAFERSGLGRFTPRRVNGQPEVLWYGTHHHIGTTRMSESPTDGVVDPRCRVHGVENLYVAGCSVFPTGGYINPTFPILTLALRICEDVHNLLTRPAPALVV